MKIWRIIAAVVVIFGAGIATGYLLAPRPHPPTSSVAVPPAMMSNSTNPAVPARQQVFLQRLHREIDLSPDQSAEVDRIMRDSRQRIQKIMEPVAPQTREETRRVRQQIQALLTPEQQKKYNEVFKRRPGSNDGGSQPHRLETNADQRRLQ